MPGAGNILLQYISAELSSKIDDYSSFFALDSMFFQTVLEYLESPIVPLDCKVTALKKINDALMIDSRQYVFTWSLEYGLETCENEKYDNCFVARNKRLFIDAIFENQQYMLLLAQCLLHVPAAGLMREGVKQEDLSGFVALRKMTASSGTMVFADTVADTVTKGRRFNDALAVAIVARTIIRPDLEHNSTIKERAAYAVVDTHLVSSMWTWFSTNTIYRLNDAKRFLPEQGDLKSAGPEQAELEKIIARKIIAVLDDDILSEDSKLVKDTGVIAEQKKKALNELQVVLGDIKEGKATGIKNAVQQWKKASCEGSDGIANGEILKAPRGINLFRKPRSAEFLEAVDIAVAYQKTNKAG